MHNNLLGFLILLLVAFLLIMLAKRLQISYPVFLVVAGLIISYIPGMPIISLNPDLIFFIFLPPLLYDAAWKTSWNDFWKWKRPIGLLSLGLVIFTSAIVAFVAHSMIPGFSWPMGFLLGGIISPPDAVSVSSILKIIKLPKRISTILEGESLVNDASSLIVFRFALAAILTGHFSLHQAITDFFVVTVMGICSGLCVAYFMFLIHRYLPTTAGINTALTLLSPYFMYLIAEQFHFSGIMAIVSGGLFLSYHSNKILADGQSRLQTLNVWSTLVIILNALVFILIGLTLPVILKGLNGYSATQAWKYGLVISGLVILIRMIYIFPSTFLPRILFMSIRKVEPAPGWKGSFIIGWAGMRGVVSLAAALSLPTATTYNSGFLNRDLIIFITFVVILVTLVFQGLTLPLIIRAIRIEEIDHLVPDDQQEDGIQIRLNQAALKRLDQHYQSELESNELLQGFKSRLLANVSHHVQRLQCLECSFDHEQVDIYNKVLIDIYHVQRNEIYQLRKEKLYSDRILRRQEIQVDLAELKHENI